MVSAAKALPRDVVSALLQRVLFAGHCCVRPTSLCGDVVGEAALDVLSDMLLRS